MQKPARKRVIVLTSLPLLVLSILFLYYHFSRNCHGLVEVLATAFFWIILQAIGAITVIVQLVLIYVRKEWFLRLFTIFLTVAVLIATSWIAARPHDYFKAPAILKGEFPDRLARGGELRLRKDGTFSATYRAIEWSCTYDGRYTITDSLILLSENLLDKTDSLFFTKYFPSGNYLLPYTKKEIIGDTSKWLKISKTTQDFPTCIKENTFNFGK